MSDQGEDGERTDAWRKFNHGGMLISEAGRRRASPYFLEGRLFGKECASPEFRDETSKDRLMHHDYSGFKERARTRVEEREMIRRRTEATKSPEDKRRGKKVAMMRGLRGRFMVHRAQEAI